MTQLANTLERSQSLSLVSTPVEHTIAELDAHSLLDQNRAALMTRVDDKYVIKQSDLHTFINNAKQHFTILQDHQLRIFPYQTVYYDTDDHQLYHQHHSGKANRLKIRCREYMHTGQKYLEVKQKNNKGITHKYRHEIDCYSNIINLSEFILKFGIKDTLTPALFVNYQRITLMHKFENQRITIDLNLKYQDARNHKTIDLDDIAIIEIKRDRHDHKLGRSTSHTCLYDLGYRPVNFSKYCMGCVLSGMPNIKKNRFKQNLLFLKKQFSIEVVHASL